ncbi:MAG: phenylalanine--tRNA ligase subunit beta [Acidimicrobiia bacterium]|nr:phenylalanine--tRNA ligase subunit beta [Acidimicrobiia bacterium]
MKASLRWLQEFVDLPTEDPGVIAATFDGLGLEVEAVTEVVADFRGVVVAKVLAIRPHPAADRVRLVTIEDGAGGREVVCGAWNFGVGATVAYATVGSRLAGGLDVGERDIRGVRSPGMICSERELGIGDEAGGILLLDDGLAPGTDITGILGLPDVVFDIAITPNRPDAMSIHGLARELGAFFGVEVRHIDITVPPSVPGGAARVRIDDPAGCPRFTARQITGVKVGPSPLWMRMRLRSAGVRPISNVVDITNYVMLETGQPMHAFDLDRIPEETIVVRRAAPGESLTTLDGVTRRLDAADLVISGPETALGLAGIMGGGDSEVAATTTRVLLEVAHFEPTGVLLTGKRHGLRSEAVARFERGVDPLLPPVASARATGLIARLAGGVPLGELIDEHPRPHRQATIVLAVREVERLLGVRLFGLEIGTLLRRLGFGVSGDDPLTVTVPSYRPDVTRPADLIEEVARLYGLDNIPTALPHGPGGGLSEGERTRRAVRAAMVGAGYSEIFSFDFIGRDHLARLGFGEDDPRGHPLAVRNPLSDELAVLRTTLLPGLLEGLRVNVARHAGDAALFEIASVVLPAPGEPIPHQPVRLGFAVTGSGPGPAWQPRPERDALDAVGLVATLAAATGVDLVLAQATEPGFHPGRCAHVLADGAVVGAVGEIHPDVAAAWDLSGRVVAGEIALEALARGAFPGFSVPSVFPPVVFDLAFDVAAAIPVGQVVAAVKAAAGPELEDATIFDVFSGPPLEAGRKSIALRLTFRHRERTMVDAEMVPVRQAIVERVRAETGGLLRGG